MSSIDAIAKLASPHGCVACIGVFDGVHRGHQALLARASASARARDVPLVALTFDPNPVAVVRPEYAPTSLATLEHRIELLLAAGADEVDVLPFDKVLAAMEPSQFVHEVLVERLGVREVVVGENFRFGHRAAGNIDTLRADGERWNFAVTAAQLVGDGTQRWSSTYARALVAGGEVAAVREVLGRAYRLDGTVVHGDHRGRELGYPTANLAWAGTPTIPADGVYAGWVDALGQTMPAAISVGTNPQFEGVERRVESYVLDRHDLDLYGEEIQVEFVERIRGQRTFDEVESLVARIGQDVDEARVLLGTRA